MDVQQDIRLSLARQALNTECMAFEALLSIEKGALDAGDIGVTAYKIRREALAAAVTRAEARLAAEQERAAGALEAAEKARAEAERQQNPLYGLGVAVRSMVDGLTRMRDAFAAGFHHG